MNKQKLEKLKNALPDVQNDKPVNNLSINKVGIREVIVPIMIYGKSGRKINTVANFSMYSHLSSELNGVNMSRFSEIIHDVIKKDVSTQIVESILAEIKKRLGGRDSYVKMKFDYFVKKKAPVSEIESFSRIPCIIEGRDINGVMKIFLTVITSYQSACPCSKAISKYNSHNQRSEATITVELKKHIAIEELVNIVNRQASCEIFNILKRVDEKYVTEHVYESPKFVEHMARDIATDLNKLLDKKINDYVVVINHFESIHDHVAVAVIDCGRNLK